MAIVAYQGQAIKNCNLHSVNNIMVHYTLQKATPADSDFFYHVKKTVLKHYIEEIWGWDEAFQIQFHHDNYRADDCSIIHLDNVPVGTVEVKENEQQIFISSLYLLPPYQQRSIGTAIINECTNRAAAHNKQVALEVLKINLHAQRLYTKLGFELKERDETKFYMYKDCTNEQDKRIV